MFPRLERKDKEGLHPTAFVFIAQIVSFILLTVGFLIFIYLWYRSKVS